MKRNGIRLLAATVAAAAMLGTMSVSASVVTDGSHFYRLGDANCDNAVDIRDIVCVKRLLAGMDTLLEPAADADSDGVVTAADLSIIKKNLLGIEPLQPDPAHWSEEIR